MAMESVYVGNLSWQTTESGLKELFAKHTDVIDVRIITDRETGRSKGFAFVEMHKDNVESVIEALSGYELDGREIIVN